MQIHRDTLPKWRGVARYKMVTIKALVEMIDKMDLCGQMTVENFFKANPTFS
jgi:hypothetical protein